MKHFKRPIEQYLFEHYLLVDRQDVVACRMESTRGRIREIEQLLHSDALLPTQGVAKYAPSAHASGVSNPTERAAERYGEQLAHFQEELVRLRLRLVDLSQELQSLNESGFAMAKALGKLADIPREIVEQRYRYGRSHSQIGTEIQISLDESTVRYHLADALTQLERLLACFGEDSYAHLSRFSHEMPPKSSRSVPAFRCQLVLV